VFERFTERARQVVVLAQEEARALGHSYIGSEHILLGLLREEEGLAARVLESLGVTLERVRAQVERIVSRGDEVTGGQQIPFTPRAKRVLELAQREALSLGQNYIGTEHILLGLAREDEGVATRILLDFDVDADTIRNEVIRMLSGPGGRHSPPQTAPRRLHRRPGLDWSRATLLWRPEGLELRIPLQLNDASAATFAADEVWSTQPLAALRREMWSGWLALASPTLLDDVDPAELRRLLDGAAKRADDRRGRDRGQADDFLRRLRGES
jgi:hypothetical protein